MFAGTYVCMYYVCVNDYGRHHKCTCIQSLFFSIGVSMYVCMYVGEQVCDGGEAVSCRGEQSQSEDCRSAKQLEYGTLYIHTYIQI